MFGWSGFVGDPFACWLGWLTLFGLPTTGVTYIGGYSTATSSHPYHAVRVFD